MHSSMQCPKQRVYMDSQSPKGMTMRIAHFHRLSCLLTLNPINDCTPLCFYYYTLPLCWWMNAKFKGVVAIRRFKLLHERRFIFFFSSSFSSSNKRERERERNGLLKWQIERNCWMERWIWIFIRIWLHVDERYDIL